MCPAGSHVKLNRKPFNFDQTNFLFAKITTPSYIFLMIAFNRMKSMATRNSRNKLNLLLPAPASLFFHLPTSRQFTRRICDGRPCGHIWAVDNISWKTPSSGKYSLYNDSHPSNLFIYSSIRLFDLLNIVPPNRRR